MGLMELPRVEPGQMIVTPHPLLLDGQRNTVWEARPGESLYGLLMRNVPELDGQPWAVSIGGLSVERHLWHHVYPKAGQVIEVRGGVGKSALAVVAMIALTYFTFGGGAIAGFSLGTASTLGTLAVQSAVYLAGSMLINKVLGPKPPKTVGQQQDSVYSISGARNQLRPYEPLPLLFGRVRITPDLLGKPYTWYEGNDQYLGLLLCAGVNVGRVEAFYNGDTVLSNYEGVQVYHAGYSQMPDEAIPLYSNADTIDGAELTKDKAWVERTTSEDTVRIQINLEYMLGGMGGGGKGYNVSETIEAQYRVVGTTAWLPLVSQRYTSKKMDAKRATMSRDVVRGQYEVRVHMLGHGNYNGGNTHYNDFQWTTLTSVQADDADYTGISRTGVRIKATGQLNGSPDELRAVGHADPIPVWNGAAWSTVESSNPGAQILAYARGIVRGARLLGGMALSDQQIDIESLKAFSLHCAANGYTYDHYIKDARNHDQVLSAIALAGFGQITWAGGRLGVVWAAQEQPLSGVVNMATIKKGQFQVDYSLSNAADGIEYTYLDSTTWETKTLRVPAPGVTTMLNPAQVSGEGVTSEAHAACLARWHLGQSLYQYKDVGYSTDIEHLSYQRLSLLALQHDMTQWGFGGRLAAAAYAAGAVTLTLDEPVPAPASGNAYIGLRIPGERVYRVLRVKPFTGESNVIELLDAWPSDAAVPANSPDNPAHDTLWVYDFKQTPGLRVRVVSIEPESDLKGAAVRVVQEGPEFWNYVLTGHYIPSPNESQLPTRPVASNLRITEQQVAQGDTLFTELTATFDITGPVGNILVLASGQEQELREVAQTQTRTATWRIPQADVYSVVVRPFAPDGTVGVAVSATYATSGADVPPVLVDLFDVQEHSGGVRLYTWGWLEDTMRSADFAGVEIRHTAGNISAPDWDEMTPIGDTGYHTAAFEAVVPASGQWTFACRSRNSSGELSIAMRTITRTLGNGLGEVIEAVRDTITQETIDRFNGDAAAVLEAVLKAGQYTDAQVAALNGILEDIVGADEWNATDTYPDGDFVRHNNVMYRALAENANVEPGTDDGVTWQVIGDYTSVGDALAAAISMSTTNASDIAVQSQRIDAVIARMPAGNGAVASEASVTTLSDALATETETRAQQIEAVQASLAGKADSSAVQLLESSVEDLEGTVTAQGQAITKVDAKLTSPWSNRIRNSSFLNQSTFQWGANPSAGGPVNVQWSPRLGAYHLFITAGSGERYIASDLSLNGDNVANPGEISTFSATVFCDGTWQLGIQYRDAAGNALSDQRSEVFPNTDGSWVRKSFTSSAAPAGTAFIVVVLWAQNTVGNFRLTQPMLNLGDVALPYIDTKAPVYQAQALTTLTSRVTPLEASASATTAVLAKMGGGGNLLENASFDIGSDGKQGWYVLYNGPGGGVFEKNIAGDGWRPQGVNNIGWSVGGTVPTAQLFDIGIAGNPDSFVPAQEGKQYILSGYMNSHRCAAVAVYIEFIDSNGGSLGIAQSPDYPVPSIGYASMLSQLVRYHVKGTAPANTVRVRLGFRWVIAAGSENPYLWLFRPMFEEATALQIEPSDWVPGSSPQQTGSAIQTLSVNINATTGKVSAINGVHLDVNGYVSGTVSENDGVRSSFIINADILRVVSPRGGARTEYSDGNWRVYDASGVLRAQWGVWS